MDSDDEPLVDIARKRKKKIKIKVKPDPAPSSASVTKKKRKRTSESSTTSSTATKKKVKVEENAAKTNGGKPAKGLKKLDKAERLQYAMQSFLWWNAKDLPPGYQWMTMEHSGVSFPEPYVPHNVKMNYNGEPVDLTPVQEEA